MLSIAAATLDLDNAKITRVERSAAGVLIHVDGATLSSRGERTTADVLIRLLNVTSESAVIHRGGGAQTPLKLEGDPPVDRVEVWKHEGPFLELQGYHRREPWVVWSFEAESIHAELLTDSIASSK